MNRTPWMLLLIVVLGTWFYATQDSTTHRTPKPVPAVDDKPVPTPGQIEVLIVHETQDVTKSANRKWAWLNTSTALRSYLKAHCKADGWRIVDPDMNPDDLPEGLREAFNSPRDSDPWITILTPTKRADGPLPETEDATLKLLQPWGGQ